MFTLFLMWWIDIFCFRLEHDRIIPTEWIMQEYRNQSLKMLKIENGHDHGNFHIQKLYVSIFYLGPDEKLCALLQNHDQMLLTTKSKESIVDTNLNLYSNIMRCGRELDEENSFCWRWTGFNYGSGFENDRLFTLWSCRVGHII